MIELLMTLLGTILVSLFNGMVTALAAYLMI